MRPSIACTEKSEKKKRGRPRKDPKSIHVTLVPTEMAIVNQWRALWGDDPSDAEVIRRLVRGEKPPARK